MNLDTDSTTGTSRETGSLWVSGTAYTNGELLRYLFKRPLADFDNPTDNPDMPQSWTRYLLYRLALDLAPDYALALDERQWLKQEALMAYEEIFPSTRSGATDFHDRTEFF